jgi:hypothetical protein
MTSLPPPPSAPSRETSEPGSTGTAPTTPVADAVKEATKWLGWSVGTNTIEGIEGALAAGADPNADYIVTLRTGISPYRELRDRETASMFYTPPLFYARSPEAVRLLVEKGANVNYTDNNDLTPLHVAIEKNKPEVALALIESGADVTAKDVEGRTPLHMGALPGVVDKILEKNPGALEVPDRLNRTPLFRLVDRRDVASVRLLLEKGANKDVRGEFKTADGKFYKNKPLSKLIELKGTPEIRELFPTPSSGTSAPGTPSTTPNADETGFQMPPYPPGAEGLRQGATPAQAVSGNTLLPNQVPASGNALGQGFRDLVSPGSAPKKGGKKTRRRKSRKARKSTLKKRRGGK